MNCMRLLVWALAGSSLAILFLLIQHWTVKLIQPQQLKRSKSLVIGGAILRWLLFSLLIILALQHTFVAMFVTFITFMITRTFLLFSISHFSLAWPGQSHSN